MELNYELTKQDYVNFIAYHQVHSYSFQNSEVNKKTMWGVGLFIAACLLSFLTKLNFFGFLIIGLFIFIIRFTNSDNESLEKTYAKKLWNSINGSDSPGMFGNHKLTLSSTGIRDTSSATTIESRWDVISKLTETRDLILIYNSDSNAFVIPKKAFLDENQKDEFLNMVNYFLYRSKLRNIPEEVQGNL